MSRHPGGRPQTPDLPRSLPPRPDAGELSGLVDDIAARSATSQASLRAVYDLTAADLTAVVSRWDVGTEPDTTPRESTDDIVVATYAQLWRQAARRPTRLPVRTWLTALALAQLAGPPTAASQ